MRKLALASAIFGLLCTQAVAECEPWVAYGQAQPVYGGQVSNPPANHAGVRGEVSLPFEVPAGKELVLKSAALEAYAQAPGGLVLAPYLGSSPPPSNGVFLFSLYSDNATNQLVDIDFHIGAGRVLNIYLMSAESPAQIVGWYLSGELCDAPQ